MPRIAAKFLAATATIPLAVAIMAAPTAAHADYYRGGYGGYRGGHYGHRGIGTGAVVGGAILGLGVGALLARPYYAPPPVVYAPPPVYYAPPPAYAYAPPAYAYAPPPPTYYLAPAYYR